jgi:feruloyl esterase
VLIHTQRYPEDFEGIMAGNAATSLLFWTGLWDAQHITNPNSPSGFIPNAALPTITNAVQTTCERAKTVPTDDFLGDPTQCLFDTGSLVPALTQQQASALEAVYNGPVTSKGVSVSPGFEPGNEAQLWPGNVTEDTLTAVPSTSQFSFGNFVPYLLQQTPATFNALVDFDVDTTPGIFDSFAIDPPSPGSAPQTVGSAFDTANPDLTAFRSRGGKIVEYHGWADPLVPPRALVGYFNSVVAFEELAQHGHDDALAETQKYYRLFMAPGMGHCRGGPGLNEFGRNGGAGPPGSDMFSALEAWVEQGVAPHQITAWNCPNQVAATATTCTITQGTFNRPVCPYPQKAVYIGTGSTGEAANFVCQ